MEFKPATWIMMMVLVALIIVPAFFMNSLFTPQDEGDNELKTPPPGIQPYTNQPKPKPPTNQPAANNDKPTNQPEEGAPAD